MFAEQVGVGATDAEATVPFTIKSLTPVVGWLKYHVPVPLAPHNTILKVIVLPAATFCKAEIPERVIAVCTFPAEVVVAPHVIVEPISVKVPPLILYCQIPVEKPVPERLIL